MDSEQENKKQDSEEALQTIHVKVREDLYRAFQRCSWIIVHDTGRTQLDIMNEMVEDFLVKHGC
jgi:hypothetical protein